MRPTDEDRYLRSIAEPDENGCRLWTEARDKDGYGVFNIQRDKRQRHVRAHRWGYEHFVGPISAGAQLLHSCDNPPCQELTHLRPGSGSDNKQDELSRGRNNPPRGERNPRAVLTEDLVREIRSLYVPRRFSYRRIAQRLGLSESAVREVIAGNNWRHVV